MVCFKEIMRHKVFVALTVLCFSTSLVFAQDTQTDLIGSGSTLQSEDTTKDNFEELVDQYKERQQKVLDTWNNKVSSAEENLALQRNKLRDKQQELDTITESIKSYEDTIAKAQDEMSTLSDQLNLIQDSMELTTLKIRAVRIQIAEKEQDLFENSQKVDIAKITMENQESVLGKFLNLIYKQDQLYFDGESNISNNPTLFVGSTSTADIIIKRKYLEAVKDTGKNVLQDLKDINLLLDVKQSQLEGDQVKLASLKTRLKAEENILEDQKAAKEQLLQETQGKEAEYQKLLAQAHADEQEIQDEVNSLQDSVGEIESQIIAYRGNLIDSSLSDAEIRERVKNLTGYAENANGVLGLQWPVPPNKGLSATFHDPGYKAKFGVEHEAIDIPQPQGSDIHAPADGYVVKVKDNGMGYSYIILAHTSGVMTLYGHVSKILVKTGDFVSTGDVIGLTGGQPGTPGAGWMTTGSHLHFEVFQDGKHVDPLLYLDPSQLK